MTRDWRFHLLDHENQRLMDIETRRQAIAEEARILSRERYKIQNRATKRAAKAEKELGQ